MLGVLVNSGAIIFGSIIGLLFSKKFTDELNDMIMTGCGVVTLVIGFQMAFGYANIVFMALSLIIGAIIGYALDIDGKVLKIGEKLEKLTKKNDLLETAGSKSNFAYAFLNSSVLFCTGAMAIVGSFEAGAKHEYTTLFTKSILDGFIAIGYASAMGVGTAFSALAILVYQGSLALLSTWIQPYVSELLIKEVSAVGGCMIVMIGLNLLNLKKIKTANFLPGLIVEIIFVVVKGLF